MPENMENGALPESENSELTADEQIISLMKKQLKAIRLLYSFMGAILVVLLITALVAVPRVLSTLNEVDTALVEVDNTLYKVNNEVIPIISKLDMEQVNKTIGVVEEAVEEFDVESLNSAVTELTKAVEAFDIEALNEAIDSLNTTIQPLKSFVQLFGKK